MKELFAILIVCTLAMPVKAIDELMEEPNNSETLELMHPNDVVELNKDSSEPDVIAPHEALPAPYKKPYSKKKLAKKFLVAMLCVAGCSVFLYGTLSVYNKIRDSFISPPLIPPEGDKPLDTPNDITEAIKTFIDKTKWG